MSRIGVAVSGHNGHQIHSLLVNHQDAELVGVHGVAIDALPAELSGVRKYSSLDEALDDPAVGFISLCSARRSEQASHAIRCLEAGKHVYAEKPCAMTEEDLDAIVAAAGGTEKLFHEMAGTAFEQPYLAMRGIVQAGTIGTVVQAIVQKSYPMHDKRPLDEDVDGGLTMQAGVHALRFIEHIGGVRIREIAAVETKLGNNRRGGDLRVAASMMMRLENGGIASAVANYLNPRAFPSWGNEMVRIFGTDGFVEATDGGRRTRLVLAGEDKGPIRADEPAPAYHDIFFSQILRGTSFPVSLEDELHPTRMVIRARASARAQGALR